MSNKDEESALKQCEDVLKSIKIYNVRYDYLWAPLTSIYYGTMPLIISDQCERLDANISLLSQFAHSTKELISAPLFSSSNRISLI